MRKLLPILILLACAIPARAQIAITGTCVADATTCTFDAVAAGDLKIIFAYRNNNVNPPSKASDWTLIDQFGTTSGGTVGSMTIGCEKAADSSDTGSGATSWSSSSTIVGISYSGTGVNATADCNTTGIGVTACATETDCWAKASGTVACRALSLSVTSGSSWVACPYGHASNFDGCATPPTGLTDRATGARAHWLDTGTGVTSWSEQTCTMSNTTWISFAMEILAAGGGAAPTRRLTLLGVGD